MATTEEIMASARELGKLIAQHPAAKKFEDTLRKLQADVEAQRVLNDYNRLLQKLGEKEQSGQPIEVADKQQLEKLQTGVIRNPTLRDFQIVQMDYLDLMRKVDDALTPGGGASMGAEPVAASPLVNPDAGRKLN